MSNKIQISPSILSADFGKLNEDIATVEPYCDSLHVDVMDGHFVPNLTFGAPVVRHIKSKLPLQCHLMVERPQDYIKPFAEAGAQMLIVHQEAAEHLHRLVMAIKEHEMKAGISINPATPVGTLEEIVDDVDQVLVMSVNPGFGGQEFIPDAVDKIRQLRLMREDLEISVDGGINDQTAKLVVEAGANVLVSGSYIFKAKDRKAAIESLRS